MAILIETQGPNALLSAIKKAIDDKKIDTWIYDADGDFSHSPEQWRYKAWLRPRISNGLLTMSILGPKDTRLSKSTYGVYHGRFIETVLTHFDQSFTTAKATANAVTGDIFG